MNIPLSAASRSRFPKVLFTITAAIFPDSPRWVWIIPAFLLPLLALILFWQQVHLRKMKQKIRLIMQREPSSHISIGFPYEPVDETLEELDLQIEHSQQLIRESEKMKRDWIEGISHDLKTPLSPIKGYAELLKDHPKLEVATRSRWIETIWKNALVMDQRIQDLKLAYQIEGSQLPMTSKRINFERTVRETVIDLLNFPEFKDRNISYISHIKSPVFVDGDERLLRRAIENILTNCLVHNDESTTVRVELFTDKQTAMVKIQDDGRGISSQEISQIFKRGHRASGDEAREASQRHEGLGLYIAWQIITFHHGKIRAVSDGYNGTCFFIEIPVASD